MNGNGGYAVFDLSFLTAADFADILLGNQVTVDKSVFDNAKALAMCAKPLYVLLPFMNNTPGLTGTYGYKEIHSATISTSGLQVTFSITITSEFTLAIIDDSPTSYYIEKIVL